MLLLQMEPGADLLSASVLLVEHPGPCSAVVEWVAAGCFVHPVSNLSMAVLCCCLLHTASESLAVWQSWVLCPRSLIALCNALGVAEAAMWHVVSC